MSRTAGKQKRKVGRPPLGARKRVRTSFTLEPEQLEWLKRIAETRLLSASEALSEAIDIYRNALPTESPPRPAASRIRIALPLPARLEAICRRHGVRRLALFGSVLTPRFDDSSDLDMLVEFLPGRSIGFFEMSELAEDLGRCFVGRQIDLRTPRELSQYFREQVLADAEEIYRAD
jgi:predicted nucleotidyltransferase